MSEDVVETYYAGVYWPARLESLDHCARQLTTLLAALAQCDPILSQWFLLGETREEALHHQVTIDVPQITDLLARSRELANEENRLGFSLWLWNGADEGDEVSFPATVEANRRS